jgi:hypothetical protein
MAARLSRSDRRRLAAGVLLYLLLLIPPVLRMLESRMVTHVAVLLPGLAVAGWLWGKGLRARMTSFNAAWNGGGIPGMLAVLLAGSYWMLPRVLDESLAHAGTELAKLTGIPVLVGFALALSWDRIGPLWRGFLEANLLSMLAVSGWLYMVAPVRLCTSYLQGDQERLGSVLLGVAGALALAWSLPWFFGASAAASAAGPGSGGSAAPERLGAHIAAG